MSATLPNDAVVMFPRFMISFTPMGLAHVPLLWCGVVPASPSYLQLDESQYSVPNGSKMLKRLRRSHRFWTCPLS